MNVKTFEELKLSGNLPSPAGVGMKILQLTRTEDYSAEEMGEAIMADSSLTGRILKLANAATRGGVEPTTTVSGAIMRLGSRAVRDMALAFSLVSERRAGTCRAFDYDLYWTRSLARAVSAQVMSRVLGVAKPEEAYICGLLGEIGRLALASVYSEKYAELLEAGLASSPERLMAAEEDAFNIDHAQVATCMLSDWGLPEAFARAVEGYCAATPRTVEKIDDLASVLVYGQVIAEACVADDETSDEEWVRLGGELERLRGIVGQEEEPFLDFCETCVKEWFAWGKSLDVSTGDRPFSAVLERIAQAREAIAQLPAGAAAQVDGGADGKSRPVSAPAAKPERDAIHVLAIDDDPVSLRILVQHLRKDGYRVDVARSGKEGLKMALSKSPDIVITDWEMPDLDGLELCTSLRRTDVGRNMYFLLLTGHESEELIVRAFDAGADDFITKPFIPRMLSARIKGGVRLARLQRKIESDKQTMMKQVAELGVLTRKLRAASLTDPLTDLPNRRYAMKRLETEWASVLRTRRDLSLVMIDIDHFKKVNDGFGHDVGDLVLKATAKVLQEAIRGSDEVCRLGGEEFLIICKNTSEEDCLILAERVRSRVAENLIPAPYNGSVTVSLGVAGSDQGTDDVEALLKASDEAVYLAKDSGRNQVRRGAEVVKQRKSA